MGLGDWTNFFLGELGAAAALAGLLFVAISVNEAKILQLGRLVDRGLEALATLLLVVIVSSLALVPGQSIRWCGAEIFGISAAALLGVLRLQSIYMKTINPLYLRHARVMATASRIAILLIGLGGLLILWRNDGAGLYLLPPGILLSFVVAMVNTWVLLIEINR